jgi:hypothetical protein
MWQVFLCKRLCLLFECFMNARSSL